MIQEFLTAWICWYYGNDQYPTELQNQMTFGQKLEAIQKIRQIKRVVGEAK